MLVDDVSDASLARFGEAFLAEVKRTRPQSDWGMIFMPAKKVEVAVGTVVETIDGCGKNGPHFASEWPIEWWEHRARTYGRDILFYRIVREANA